MIHAAHFKLENTYSQNWYLDISKLDSILPKVAAFDYKNYGFLRFYGQLGSFYAENRLLKYYLIVSFHCIICLQSVEILTDHLTDFFRRSRKKIYVY